MRIIDHFVDKVSHQLKNKYPDELPSYGIIRYALKFIITNTIPIFLIIMFSLIFGNLKESLIAILGFSLLRIFSGGFHFQTPEKCIIFSTVMIILISELGYYFTTHTFIMFIVSLLIVLIYAPSDIQNQTKVKKENYKWFKIISLLLVSIFYLIDNPISNLAILVQSILLIRLKGGGKEE
ncbi:accessory gene regulator B family protein [Paenibacillus sp. EKM102P]|uniref:accessory gene regulator ArgB-like protein n=1 Tax=unclassified Paenibacillus TaxID=185978 RepID=UPI00142DB7C1|nr:MULTISPECIES: accessory gene regulator B family protein [unclassified Paenibacillus]KAF6620504.1 accessory gene regulator B family protein [Paenibacillus sp. EKM101P]KAF6623496.1 accessory gene regulator B family protein [Paenibacillus sp. EKM102P]KAF6633940.1 accessory gene regulator B family protein [Paenibacillus sp. EKM10P]KAF6649468.1 accessory gene regulator B family protein [Paenibacillus sp. EKM11P]